MDGIGNFFISSISNIVNRSKIPNFPYTIGEPVTDNSQSIWTIHDGIKNDSKAPVTVFIFRKDENKYLAEYAQNAVRRAKTLRHPDLIQYLDSAETNDSIYVVTESVKPMSANNLSRDDHSSVAWGLFKLSRGMKFINDDCSLVHGNIQFSSVYLTQSLEWKLFGFELLDSLKETAPKFTKTQSLGAKFISVATPEIKNNQANTLQNYNLGITDAYQFGELLSSIAQKNVFGDSPETQNNLQRAIVRLMNSNPASRATISKFYLESVKANRFFDLPIVHSMSFIEEIPTKEPSLVREFLINASKDLNIYPKEMFKFKILPEILKKMRFGGEDSQLLSIILKIQAHLTQDDFESIVVPSLLEAFSSNDRQLRYNLLRHLNDFIGSISSDVISQKIFPNFMSGFQDNTPIIREETARASLVLAPHLSEKNINNDLIRSICRLCTDPEPGIRANSLICIGKLSKHINKASMKQFVLPALLHSLRDPFPPSRVAALKVITVCSKIIDPNDAARKIIPMLSILLVDTEKTVRDASNSGIISLLSLIVEYGKSLPDTAIKPKETNRQDTENNSSDQSTPAQQVSSSGWAISSLTSGISGVISYTSGFKGVDSASEPGLSSGNSSVVEVEGIISSNNDTKPMESKNLVIHSLLKKTQSPASGETTSSFSLYQDNFEADEPEWGFKDSLNVLPKAQNKTKEISLTNKLNNMTLEPSKKNSLGLKPANKKTSLLGPTKDSSASNQPLSNKSEKAITALANSRQNEPPTSWDSNGFDSWGDDPSSWSFNSSNPKQAEDTPNASSTTRSVVASTSKVASNVVTQPRLAAGLPRQPKFPSKTTAGTLKPKSRLGAVKLTTPSK